jgi:hypothetical protein
MSYVITGLSPAPFKPLFGLSDEALAAQGVIRVTAEAGGLYPCRVSLEDARPGETLLLLNYEHQPAETPYRSRHAIFVNENARAPARCIAQMPAILTTRRLIALRAYDEAGMIVDADTVPGPEVEAICVRMLASLQVAYIHAHNPGRGCYAARIDRA